MENNSNISYVYNAGKNSSVFTNKLIVNIVLIVVAGLLGTLCSFIPLIGWILSIACGIFGLIEIIGLVILILGYTSIEFGVTETGIHFKNFAVNTDFTFDQINKVYNNNGKIMLEVKLPNNAGNRVLQYLFAEDADAFCRAYEEQAKKTADSAEAEA